MRYRGTREQSELVEQMADRFPEVLRRQILVSARRTLGRSFHLVKHRFDRTTEAAFRGHAATIALTQQDADASKNETEHDQRKPGTLQALPLNISLRRLRHRCAARIVGELFIGKTAFVQKEGPASAGYRGKYADYF